MNIVSCGISGERSWRYEPIAANACSLSPTIFPSDVAYSSTYWTWSRPCVVARMFSLRVSIHFTGVPPRAFETATAANSSA